MITTGDVTQSLNHDVDSSSRTPL